VLQTVADQHPPWIDRCLQTVSNWTEQCEFDHRLAGDSIRQLVPRWVWEKTCAAPQAGFDLLRLVWIERTLASAPAGTACLWLDADVLVLDPVALRNALPWKSQFAVGRENWLECAANGSPRRVRSHVHNAALWAAHGNAVVPFYRYAAERILRRVTAPFVPQLIGPKLLASWHNVIGFDVIECCTMLSPDLAQAILTGNQSAIGAFLDACDVAPAAVNLCGSMLDDDRAAAIVQRLLAVGWP
jgi:hypothetical protein